MDEFHKLKSGGSGGKPAWLNAKSAGSPLSRASGVTHEGDYGGIEQKGRNNDKVYARPELEHRKSGGRTDGKFIQHAIKRPGALTRKAKAAGMSIPAFAHKHEHDTDLTGRQSRFYTGVLSKVRRK